LQNFEKTGSLAGYKRIIIASDGGPSHFKVYKTQHWMSKWACDLAENGVHIEWNMFFANLGHNICDSHAGHMKRCAKSLNSTSELLVLIL
jgi:hypothetical protein